MTLEEQERKQTILRCLEELIQDEVRIKEFSRAVDRDRTLTNACMNELVLAYSTGDIEKVDYLLDFLSGIRNDVKLGVDLLDNGYVGPESAKYLRGNVLSLLGRITLTQQCSKYMGANKVPPGVAQLIKDAKKLAGEN